MPAVTATIDGDLRQILSGQVAPGFSRAVLSGMTAASARTKQDLREQTAAAGLGPKLEKAWQDKVFPTDRSGAPVPAALVYSKATVIHAAFSYGATITAVGGRFLAIPTAEGEALGFAYSSVSRKGGPVPGGQLRHASQVSRAIATLGAKNIRFVRARNGRVLVLYTAPASKRGGRTSRGLGGRALTVLAGRSVVIFILIPQVRLAPRLSLDATRGRAGGYLADAVSAALEGADL